MRAIAYLIAAILSAAILTGCGATTPTATKPDSSQADEGKPKKATPRAATIGDAVEDGKFTFKVTAIKPGPKQIGDQYLNKKPQGKYIFVYVTVRNHGNKAQIFVGDQQKLLAGKTEYSADSEAAIYLGDKASSLFEEINPGNVVKGIIVYDVPKNVKPTGIELHDSIFSRGVKIVIK